MDYRVYSALSGEEDSSTEAHVFARAYRAAWRSAYATEPTGRHKVEGLELVIDFGRRALARSGNPEVAWAPTTRCAERSAPPDDVLPGERNDN